MKRIHRKKRLLRKVRGSALLVSLMVIVGLSLLGLGFVAISETETAIAKNQLSVAQTQAVAEAGAFSLVIEAVAEPLAKKITTSIDVPTIGIGASAACDGQVLVLEDMLGLSPWTPKFVKRYGNLGPAILTAIENYADEVRSRAFPGPEHVYGMAKPVKPKAEAKG